MTKEEAYKLKRGDKVYIWGCKEKPQEISWAGVNVFGAKTDAIRFKTGMFFSIEENYEHIELAPQDVEPEERQVIKTPFTVRRVGSCDFTEVLIPVSRDGVEYNKFLEENLIFKDDHGNLVTNNIKLFKK